MEKSERRYEIVKELFLPCTTSLLPHNCEIEERQLSSPWDYVRSRVRTPSYRSDL